jgi:hypothetical protein
MCDLAARYQEHTYGNPHSTAESIMRVKIYVKNVPNAENSIIRGMTNTKKYHMDTSIKDKPGICLPWAFWWKIKIEK